MQDDCNASASALVPTNSDDAEGQNLAGHKRPKEEKEAEAEEEAVCSTPDTISPPSPTGTISSTATTAAAAPPRRHKPRRCRQHHRRTSSPAPPAEPCTPATTTTTTPPTTTTPTSTSTSTSTAATTTTTSTTSAAAEAEEQAAPGPAKRRRNHRHVSKPKMEKLPGSDGRRGTQELILPRDKLSMSVLSSRRDRKNWGKLFKHKYRNHKKIQIFTAQTKMSARMEPDENTKYNERIAAFQKLKGNGAEFTSFWLQAFVGKKPRSRLSKVVILCAEGSEEPGTTRWRGWLEGNISVERILLDMSEYFPRAQLFIISCPHAFGNSERVVAMQRALQEVADKRQTPVWLAGHIGDGGSGEGLVGPIGPVGRDKEYDLVTTFIQYSGKMIPEFEVPDDAVMILLKATPQLSPSTTTNTSVICKALLEPDQPRPAHPKQQ
ncbi:hypothetical protein Pelo_14024 [Pelomyxa schiedti]|nr:hypothetical protein Pelo_14024 [Pelomyxa schiedti]